MDLWLVLRANLKPTNQPPPSERLIACMTTKEEIRAVFADPQLDGI
jgi:hypothetical protein